MELRFASVQHHVARLAPFAVAAALFAAAPAAADVAIEPDQTTVAEVTGNGNGWLDPGEQFTLTQTVHTLEYPGLTGVSGVLSGDPAVTLSAAQSAWPDLAFGMPTANLTPFAGTVAATAECGASLPMQLAFTTSGGPATVPVALSTGGTGAFASYDTTAAQAIPDPGTITSTVSVPTTGRIKALRIRIGELDHTYVGDLRIELVAPDGTTVLLAPDDGRPGVNFVGTVLDSGASVGIWADAAPYTGSFRPVDDLGALNGHQLQGDWQLRVTDSSWGEHGALLSWGLDAAVAVCAPPPAPGPPGAAQRSPNAKGQWPSPPGWEKKGGR